MAGLTVELDMPLPSTLAVGAGNHLFVRGRCFHPDGPLRDLSLLLDGRPVPVVAHSMALSEATLAGPPSAFWARAPIGVIGSVQEIAVGLRATVRGGGVETRELGTVRLLPDVERYTPVARSRIAICSVASGTSREVLLRQLDSFRSDLPDWTWIVVDDRTTDTHALDVLSGVDRVVVVHNERRLGPLASFERAIASCDADLIAVDCGGEPLDGATINSLLNTMGVASAVGDSDGLLGDRPAAPCVLTRTLLSAALPFPPDAGTFDIGRWITACAGASARSAGGNERPSRTKPRRPLTFSRSSARRAVVDKAKGSSGVVSVVLAQAAVSARTLLMRGVRSEEIARLADADTSVVDLARVPAGRPLVASLLALRALSLRLRMGSVRNDAERAPLQTKLGAQIAKLAFDMSPLRLDVSSRAPRRVNVLVPMIDFRYVFGAYLMIFHLALALHERGLRIRLLIVQEPPRSRERWRSELRGAPGLEHLLDVVEIEDATDRSVAVEVAADDVFLATTSWTAHVAAAAVNDLGRERFPFLVMEYDPLVFPTGSRHELAAAAYRAPHDAIFSTELLRRYFQSERIGVYSQNVQNVVVIDNPVAPVTLDAGAMRVRARKRLLFYARPEDHAQRNLFELGVLALRRAAELGGLADLDVEGVGALEDVRLGLGAGIDLEIHPRVTLDAYLDMLPRYDVGLALQATPHPGLVALDMAAAGLVVVTNTYATKTADDLSAISPNILAPAPTVHGVADAIVQAAARAGEIDARVRGADLNWPRTWSDAMSPRLVDEILALPSLR